jgi:hypothetical protein
MAEQMDKNLAEKLESYLDAWTDKWTVEWTVVRLAEHLVQKLVERKGEKWLEPLDQDLAAQSERKLVVSLVGRRVVHSVERKARLSDNARADLMGEMMVENSVGCLVVKKAAKKVV